MSEHRQSLFLAPHNDDETLFGSYTLLRENPHVVVVLRSMVQEERGYGITFADREQETAAALKELGVSSWEQWPIKDTAPNWVAVEIKLRGLPWAPKVYAPAVEDGGHPHHNSLGELALRVFPGRVKPYLTYTVEGKSEWGEPVPVEDGWEERKRAALGCYVSQARHPSTAAHFDRSLTEYYA